MVIITPIVLITRKTITIFAKGSPLLARQNPRCFPHFVWCLDPRACVWKYQHYQVFEVSKVSFGLIFWLEDFLPRSWRFLDIFFGQRYALLAKNLEGINIINLPRFLGFKIFVNLESTTRSTTNFGVLKNLFSQDATVLGKIIPEYIPAPSKGCQLNPKGYWIDTL